jgi:carbamoylphosphate synthase large subunit
MKSFLPESIDSLKFPLIIKPNREAHGNGVMMNIQTFEELKEKLSISFEKYSNMIIQEQVE